MLTLGSINPRNSGHWPVILVVTVAFLLIGPYSYLAGAIALDQGGKHGGATTSGIVDFVGYLGGVMAGQTVADLSVSQGWGRASRLLGAVAGVAALASSLLLILQSKTPPGNSSPVA